MMQKVAIGVMGALAGIIIGKAIHQMVLTEENAEIPANNHQQNEDNKQQPQDNEHLVNQSIRTYEEDINLYDTIEENMTCPISGCIMRNPVVVTECGHTFERKQIINWIRKEGTCPLCKVKVRQDKLRSNYHLKQVIRVYQKNKKSEHRGQRQVQNKNI